MPTLRLAVALGSRLAAGHPWIYRDQVPGGFDAKTGDWVHVTAGTFSGYGLWDEQSAIAVRVFSRKRPPNADWVAARVSEAWALRRDLLRSGTTAFRLIFGEGDALPGIVVDYYDGYCLLAAYSDALADVQGWVTSALMQLGHVRGVVRRDPTRPSGLEVLAGTAPEPGLTVREGPHELGVDLARGQKTGLFLDHRDNRRFVAAHARDKTVLNLFCYTGAFSLSALEGGAKQVTSVDSAAPSIQAARENFSRNGYDPSASAFHTEDAFEYLDKARTAGRTFDLVISDPPSFAKRREQLRQALKAYRRLAGLCLRVTAPGGVYAAASCTSQVSPDQFRQTLEEAALRTNRRVQLIHEAYHAVDHPTFLAHPEGRYLKFVVVRVLEPC